MIKTSHHWCDPLELASSLQQNEANFVFLYSSLKTSYSGNKSWIGLDVEEICQDIDKLDIIDQQKWFGYFAYELDNLFDQTELWKSQPSWINIPPVCWMKFRRVLCFDHENQTITEFHREKNKLDLTNLKKFTPTPVASIKNINCTFPKNEYLQVAEKTIAAIHAGDFYQANITRKYYGEFSQKPDDFSIFLRLCAASPAPYSAFMRINNTSIISSSPELFLKIKENGEINTRPIKGTKSLNSSSNELQNSSKDRAENLMIVDLMRNDLSKICKIGSVKIGGLYEVDDFSTLRHLSSDINGRLKENISPVNAALHCLPPGSMTGAPKKRAIEWCATYEKMRRGIYSGCLGWLSEKEAELSVVIRTIILQDKSFEFQVGGGIVADSSSESEWEETLTKASGVARALGITVEDLMR